MERPIGEVDRAARTQALHPLRDPPHEDLIRCPSGTHHRTTLRPPGQPMPPAESVAHACGCERPKTQGVGPGRRLGAATFTEVSGLDRATDFRR